MSDFDETKVSSEELNAMTRDERSAYFLRTSGMAAIKLAASMKPAPARRDVCTNSSLAGMPTAEALKLMSS